MIPANQRGVTLIEVLAAAVILSFAVLAFVNISDYTFLADSKSSESVEALRIAEEQLSFARDYIIRNNAVPDVSSSDGYTVTLQTAPLTAGTISYETSAFLEKHISLQSIVPLNNTPTLLTVTVSWS